MTKKAAAHEHGRGEIKDNALKALVTSTLFRTRMVKAKKGKGAYNRKGRKSDDYALFVFMSQPAVILPVYRFSHH